MKEIAKTGAGAPRPLLAGLFSRTARLARFAALLNALLCGAATDRLIVMFAGCSRSADVCGVIFGLFVAFVVYLALAPESMVTGCLVSTRTCFLDNQVTRSECRQMRTKCLRRSLRY